MEHSLYNKTELIEGPWWGATNEYQTDILVVVKTKMYHDFTRPTIDWCVLFIKGHDNDLTNREY